MRISVWIDLCCYSEEISRTFNSWFLGNAIATHGEFCFEEDDLCLTDILNIFPIVSSTCRWTSVYTNYFEHI